MREIKAIVANEKNIEKYGRFFGIKSVEARTGTGGWEAWTAKGYMMDSSKAKMGIMGMKGLPFPVTQMTRSMDSDIALIPGNSDFVVALADTDSEHADTKDLCAFVVKQGTAIRIKKGVWHSACRWASDADGQKFCYFLIDSDEIVYKDVEGEQVIISF